MSVLRSLKGVSCETTDNPAQVPPPGGSGSRTPWCEQECGEFSSRRLYERRVQARVGGSETAGGGGSGVFFFGWIGRRLLL